MGMPGVLVRDGHFCMATGHFDSGISRGSDRSKCIHDYGDCKAVSS